MPFGHHQDTRKVENGSMKFYKQKTRGLWERALLLLIIKARGLWERNWLNANNIRLLTKCDVALLSFRYTSICILLAVLLCSIAEYFYKLCRILASP